MTSLVQEILVTLFHFHKIMNLDTIQGGLIIIYIEPYLRQTKISHSLLCLHFSYRFVCNYFTNLIFYFWLCVYIYNNDVKNIIYNK